MIPAGVRHSPMATAAAALSFNYLTVTGLIFVNKVLFSVARFPPTTLTAMHLAFTAGAIHLAQRLGFAARPTTALSWRYTLLLAALQGCAIVAGNASLTFNSMSFYQLAKQLQLPVVICLEFAFFGKFVSLPRMLWLAGAVAGVVTATTTDVHFNLMGAACAVTGVVCTATEVVIWSRLQQHHNWGSLELLGSVSPYGAALTGAAAAAWESHSGVGLAPALSGAGGLLLLSCATALLVNWSTVMVSGKASAITYALLGLFKTASVLVGGAVFFDGVPSPTALAAATFALMCIFGYSAQNIRERQRAAAQEAAAKVSDEEQGRALTVPPLKTVVRRSASMQSTPGVSDEDVSPTRSADGESSEP